MNTTLLANENQYLLATPSVGAAAYHSAAPAPGNWQGRVLRALIEDNRDLRNTRYGVLTETEVAAIETILPPM